MQLYSSSIECLDYRIPKLGITATDRGIEAALNFPVRSNVRELQSFIRLVAYFRKFIEGCSVLAKPLCDLLRKEFEFEFD